MSGTPATKSEARRWPARLATIGVVVLAMCGLSAATAQADPFTISAENAYIDLGSLTHLQILDGTTGPATFTGTITGNQVTIPPEGLQIPPKVITDPVSVTITITANQPITGTFDSTTGALSLNASLKATTAGAANCTISPIPITLGTANKTPYYGTAFSGGLSGTGAFSASWSSLPNATGGGLCGVFSGVLGGPGGIWISHGIPNPRTCTDDPTNVTCTGPVDNACATNPNAPGCGGGSPCTANPNAPGCKPDDPCVANPNAPGCKKGDPCAANPKAAGCTKGPPTPGKAALSLKAAKTSLKAKTGKTAKLTFTVKNTGGTAASSAKVCVKLPKKKVLKASSCKNVGSLAAGASKTVTFSVKTTTKARKHTYKLTFTASASGVAAKKATTKLSVR